MKLQISGGNTGVETVRRTGAQAPNYQQTARVATIQ